jgi:hypothetical protein
VALARGLEWTPELALSLSQLSLLDAARGDTETVSLRAGARDAMGLLTS